MPDQSLDGDVCLVLEGGMTLRAHSVYLQHASAVLQSALQCAPPQAQNGGQAARDVSEGSLSAGERSIALTRLPLPGVTQRQAGLLVTCLYSWDRHAWCDTLSPPEIVELARVSHRLACPLVLEMADNYMVQKCGVKQDVDKSADETRAWLTVADAPGQFELAQQLHLTSYGELVGRFMGRHAHEIDTSMCTPETASILAGARLIKRQKV